MTYQPPGPQPCPQARLAWAATAVCIFFHLTVRMLWHTAALVDGRRGNLALGQGIGHHLCTAWQHLAEVLDSWTNRPTSARERRLGGGCG